MLILTRKQAERIVIDGPCVIEVVGFKGGGRVQIGIDARRSTQVWRAELLEPVPGVNVPGGLVDAAEPAAA